MSIVPDIVDVVSADTFLKIGQTPAGRMLFAEEVRREGLHAGGIEKHRRVVFRHERSGRENDMSPLFKKSQKSFAHFGGRHMFNLHVPGQFLKFFNISLYALKAFFPEVRLGDVYAD